MKLDTLEAYYSHGTNDNLVYLAGEYLNDKGDEALADIKDLVGALQIKVHWYEKQKNEQALKDLIVAFNVANLNNKIRITNAEGKVYEGTGQIAIDSYLHNGKVEIELTGLSEDELF